MLEWVKLFPPYLIVLTAVFVIIPTTASFFIRYSIYRHLNDLANKITRLLKIGESRGIQPKLVEELEIRYKVATSQLEQVNTGALIDGIYSQEKFKFFGFSLRCEQWDYFCRILPNLLLAFGLLGTFLGITTNLYNLSQTINSVENDVNSLVQQLQTPLQSMGIAFITSLVALLCSSFLIVINLRCNTNLAKYRLISSLEDYLDNIFKPKVQGDSRLDKAVNRMVEQQHEFLMRFHEKVGQVMESTLGQAALKIAEENKIANSLAKEVYERFLESSGTLARSTNTFKDATLLLDGQVKNLIDIVPHFKILENSAVIFQEASKRIERSKFSENLENLTVDLAKTQKAFSQSTAFLGNNLKKVIDGNQKATELAEKVYSQFQESSIKLQDSAVKVLKASEQIEKSQFADKLVAATNDLANVQSHFLQSASSLDRSTQSIEKALTELQNSAQSMIGLGNDIGNLNKQSANLIECTEKKIENERENLEQVWSQVNILIETIERNEQKANLELQKLGDRFANKLVATTNNLANVQNQFSQSTSSLDRSTQSIEKALTELQNSAQNMTGFGERIRNLNKQSTNLIELTEKRIKNEPENWKQVWSQVNILIETIERNEQKANLELQKLGDRFSHSVSTLNQFANLIKFPQTKIENENFIDDNQKELNELALAQIRELLPYFEEEMPDKIRRYYNHHNVSRVEAEAIANYYQETANIIRNVKSKNNLRELITHLEALKEKISVYQHEKFKYRWSTGLQNEVLKKLYQILNR
jgi:hypothetical protein